MDNLNYFFAIAEELNINKAAKKLFVTQQYLSKYLKNLEAEYGTQLFYRRPSLSLTPEGRLFLIRMKQIRGLEIVMKKELSELKENPDVELTLGTSLGRALFLLPVIVPIFREQFPKIKFKTKTVMTSQMHQQIINGDLDIGLALSLPPSPDIEQIFVTHENVYLAISNGLLMDNFPEDYPECIEKFKQGVNLNEFANISFMINPTISRTYNVVQSMLAAYELDLNFDIEINSNEVQLLLASKCCGACFFPQFLIRFVELLNTSVKSSREHVNIFPINGIESFGTTVSIAYLKERKLSASLDFFISLLRNNYIRLFG